MINRDSHIVNGLGYWTKVLAPEKRFVDPTKGPEEEQWFYTTKLLLTDPSEIERMQGLNIELRTNDDWAEGHKYITCNRRYQIKGKPKPTPVLIDENKEPGTIEPGNESPLTVQFKRYSSRGKFFCELEIVQYDSQTVKLYEEESDPVDLSQF